MSWCSRAAVTTKWPMSWLSREEVTGSPPKVTGATAALEEGLRAIEKSLGAEG